MLNTVAVEIQFNGNLKWGRPTFQSLAPNCTNKIQLFNKIQIAVKTLENYIITYSVWYHYRQ